MDIDRMQETYRYADRKARFLYNEGFRVQWNGRPTKQLRAIINNYCKKDGFDKTETKMITDRIITVMFDLEKDLYR